VALQDLRMKCTLVADELGKAVVTNIVARVSWLPTHGQRIRFREYTRRAKRDRDWRSI
jgi:hypothetical protein